MIDITELYVEVDDFCKCFLSELYSKLIETGIKRRKRNHLMIPGEIITILIYFNFSNMKNFKAYYLTLRTELKE